jgi:hypothetical protein
LYIICGLITVSNLETEQFGLSGSAVSSVSEVPDWNLGQATSFPNQGSYWLFSVATSSSTLHSMLLAASLNTHLSDSNRE